MHDDLGKIQMPTDHVLIESLCESIASKYNVLGQERVCFAVDGLKLMLEQSSDCVIQERFYNGWTHDHYVTNVFTFAPNGTIVDMVINGPGNMHDSTLALYGGVYDRLEKFYDYYDVKAVVDSAFMSVKMPNLIQSAQTTAHNATARDLLMHAEATSVRQMAEWGMRGLQGSFPRLKDRFIYEERGERAVVLQLLPRLYNMRVNMIGINQIRSTYMPHLSIEAQDYI